MLIELQVDNFRSFKERQVFSMVAGQTPDRLEENTFDPGLKNFPRVMRSAAVYGPNASGKTNLLRALQFMKTVVEKSAEKKARYAYNPFKLSQATRDAPSSFQITFVRNSIRYEYAFALGREKVESEWLVEYAQSPVRTKGRLVFDRKWNAAKNDYDWRWSKSFKGQKSTWSKSTRPDALFVSTAVQLNSDELLPVFEWFQKQLFVIVDDVSLNATLTVELSSKPGGKESLIQFLQEADLNISDFQIKREHIMPGVRMSAKPLLLMQQQPDGLLEGITVTTDHPADDNSSVTFDLNDESSGTQLLFMSAGAWLNVLQNSEVLIIDEVDKSLHPHLARFLIQKFHDSRTNPANAQLICTTHNPLLMELFRRDQIWFTEKDKLGASKLYPLSDFKPRNDEVLNRWYMRGRYGALPILPTGDS
jgi:AAA15 family ATPase/GTPase